jgi:hypothetical protein
MYQFIYDKAQVDLTEKLFIQNNHQPESVNTVFLAYRKNKVINKNLPQKDIWRSKIIYPVSRSDHKFKPGILALTISRNFHRSLGDFDPYEYKGEPPSRDCFAVYLAPDPKNIIMANKKFLLDSIDMHFNDSKIILDRALVPIESHLVREIDRQKKKTWFHFETDTKEHLPHQYVKSILKKHGIDVSQTIIIETKHGYHYLLPINLVTGKVYQKVYEDLFDKCPTLEDGNKNSTKMFTYHALGRIPVPGTIQYGFPVRFVASFDDTKQ